MKLSDIERFRLTPQYLRSYRDAVEQRRSDSIVREFHRMVEVMTPEQEETLAELPYREFLETRYWRVLGRFVRWARGSRCERCPRRLGLEVHHLNYNHVGAEYRHLDDLIVLCRRCHQQEHAR